jgi:hypothetical protein
MPATASNLNVILRHRLSLCSRRRGPAACCMSLAGRDPDQPRRICQLRRRTAGTGYPLLVPETPAPLSQPAAKITELFSGARRPGEDRC